MALQTRIAEHQPMLELNTTPLIDVMLVLLIMFIITIPIQTHAVKLDLPTCANCPTPQATVNTVTIDRTGQVAWNDTPITRQDLRYLLDRTQQMRPTPELHLRPDAGAGPPGFELQRQHGDPPGWGGLSL